MKLKDFILEQTLNSSSSMNQKFSVLIKKKIKKFNKTICVESDKSISHRALLIASQCMGISYIKGILESEDTLNTIKCLRSLGVKILKKNKSYLVYGNGLGSLRKPSKKILYCGNAGTLVRLLCGLLATSNFKTELIGDNSLNRRPMKRIIDPLSKIGANFYPKNRTTLPLTIEGTSMPLAQKHLETHHSSAQVKSSIMLSSLNTPGITSVHTLPSRDHTENLLKYIKSDIKIKKTKKENLITLKGQKNLFSFNLEIFGDQSSCAPFIVLALLTPKSKLIIKNLNCSRARLGYIEILKKMNGKIKIVRKRKKYGEHVGDVVVESSSLKPINCPKKLVPFAIDEFPLLFITSALIAGKSRWNNIAELRAKEADRIKVMEIGLNKIGIRTKSTKDSLTIVGNPNLQINKILHIFPRNDHRIAMAFFCLKQLVDGKILIHNFECVKTSFPKFLMTMKKIGAKYEIQK